LLLRLNEHILNEAIYLEDKIGVLLYFKQQFCPKNELLDALLLYIVYDLGQILELDSKFDYLLKHTQKGL